MNIILGVFDTESFDDLKKKYSCRSFGYDWVKLDVNPHYDNLMGYIHGGIYIADKIYFDLTHIQLKIEKDSFDYCVTLNELLLIITTPEYLEKTIFFKNGKRLNKKRIVNRFLFQKYWNQYL